MERLICEHCHHVPAEGVLEILGADLTRGLSAEEVIRRREAFGPNRLTERKERSPLVGFLLQFHQPLVYLLLAATVVTAVLKEVVDAAVIFGVILVNAIVGFVQETKAQRAVHALSGSLSSSATVLRDGDKRTLPAADLVVGDVVLLQAGDKVPADLRLVQTKDLRVNESALTGEAVPAQKSPEALSGDTALADRTNMGFSSTLVTHGTGLGVVVAIGDGTEIGRISELIARTDALETPLTRKIRTFSTVLLLVVLGLAGVMFVGGLLHGESPADLFMASVALAVGAIPEGLPAAVTIIMATGVARMARRKAIIRRLPAVETLGSTTVICSDKTGTLTRNEMTVQAIVAGGDRLEVGGSGHFLAGEIRGGGPSGAGRRDALEECLRCGVLCSDAELLVEGDSWRVEGDPTEGALLVAAAKSGMEIRAVRERFPRVDLVPFDSQRQFMATLHAVGGGPQRRAYLKGSLEAVLARSKTALSPAGETTLDADGALRAAEDLASAGLRVLAFAAKELAPSQSGLGEEDVRDGFTFLGIQGMADPPRAEAAEAVALCQDAGIAVKMITGDHASTAASIAEQVGILRSRGEGPRVLTSRELEQLTDPELAKSVRAVSVFARVSPDQKLRLVEALQRNGEIVAMTGDGVNDAPALRRADIGVAMGKGGTEVAREAADMVLTDDNFASIAAAVEEGRGVFDNLQKFIVWTLPTNGGEALVLLGAVLLGLPLPILPVQLLWINMMTATCLGTTLAFEPKEEGIMRRLPNLPQTPLLSGTLVRRIVLVSLLLCLGVFGVYEWELSHGASLVQARTAAVATVVFGELFYLFNCRSFTRSFVGVGLFSNRWVWIGAGLMAVFQVLFTYLPALNRLFESAPLSLETWAGIVGVALVVSLAVGVEKMVRRRLARGS